MLLHFFKSFYSLQNLGRKYEQEIISEVCVEVLNADPAEFETNTA